MDRGKVEEFLEQAVSSEDLAEACRRLGVKISGRKGERIDRILDAVPNWETLVGLLPLPSLREACEVFRLDATGTAADLGSRLKAALEGMSVDQIPEAWDRYFGEEGDEGGGKVWGTEPAAAPEATGTPIARDAGPAPVQPIPPTRENLIGVLRSLRLTVRLRDEYDAQEALFDALAERFGDAVGREKAMGGYTFTRVDIDVDGTFGIEVKHADSLLRERGGHATEVERLLGQIVLYRRHYAPENVLVVVAGPVEPEQRAALRELRRLVEEDQKGVLIHVEGR